jgi:hypothetical protein
MSKLELENFFADFSPCSDPIKRELSRDPNSPSGINNAIYDALDVSEIYQCIVRMLGKAPSLSKQIRMVHEVAHIVAETARLIKQQ